MVGIFLEVSIAPQTVELDFTVNFVYRITPEYSKNMFCLFFYCYSLTEGIQTFFMLTNVIRVNLNLKLAEEY